MENYFSEETIGKSSKNNLHRTKEKENHPVPYGEKKLANQHHADLTEAYLNGVMFLPLS